MKFIATIMIIIGLTIAIYPAADSLYTRYLESQLLDEWEEPFFFEELSEESANDFEQLQLVFEEGQTDADLLDVDLPEVNVDFEISEDNTQEAQPLDTEDADPTNAPSPKPSPASSRSPEKGKKSKLQAIGRIKISKIDVSIPILEGTSKSNLKVGAGHVSGTSKIGTVGNAALAAHRSHTYGRMFNRLEELEVGDKIEVSTNDGTFEYTIYKIHVVEPDDISVLYRSKEDKVLTLITCTPLYTATHRLIVHAVTP
ncbi:MAG: class D sortase [Clostridiales bacterium]|nr:class D sortase [Clostridiales bacterium]